MSGDPSHSKLRPHAYAKADVNIICFSLADGKYFAVDPDHTGKKAKLWSSSPPKPNVSFCNVMKTWLPEINKCFKDR